MLKKLLAMLLVAAMLVAGFAFAEETEHQLVDLTPPETVEEAPAEETEEVADEAAEEEAVEEEAAEEEVADEEAAAEEDVEDIEDEHTPAVVLYTNDVHCGIDSGVGYAGIAGYEEAYWNLGYDVLLVDNGDAIQGDAIGTLSQGEYIIDIMNELDYDIAIPGNHEFDYGMEQFMDLTELANFPYISANFMDADGEPVFDPYVIEDLGGWSVAFVGVCTPETFTKSTPTFFQDEDGNYIYSFCQGNDGKDLYAAVQNAVNDAREEGADFVIVMSHLGIDGSSSPYTSSELIANTTGIDAVLDGHSHSVIPGEAVQNADGEDVILTSTGTKLQNLGSLTIAPDGTLSTELHDEYTLFKDEYMVDYIDSIESEYEDTLEEVVASTDVKLTTTDPEATDEEGNPLRIVRSQETNLGDLCADAYRALLDADIGLVNGGGIRADIEAGDITYGQIIAVHPFGNMACLVEASGQDILDALEMSVRMLPDENGGFLQVSGLTFDVDVSVPSSVTLDDQGNFVEVSGDRRVSNVMVNGEPIDPAGTYTVASHNYMLKSGGDGMNMFMDDPVLRDEVLIDNQVLINYIVDELGGVVGEEYAEPYGQGRITIKE